MSITRRRLLTSAALAAAAPSIVRGAEDKPKRVTVAELEQILKEPVLKLDAVKKPVKVASIELLRTGKTFLVRTRSADGEESITVPNTDKMAQVYPFFLKDVAPVFIGQDARDLEKLLWDVYRHASNYKMQGIALWVCVAAIEISLLELLSQVAERPVADFFGGAKRRDIPVYFASGNRGNKPEAEVEYLQKLVADSGVKALKFRLGGRMNRNEDSLPKRTEELIPLVRKTLGKDFTLYGDANSSYDVAHAVPIGKLMEEHGYAFYEEPCEFDDLWATKQVADTLKIPVACGEQEFSLNRWKWVIANRGVDIVQPDIHYGGGFIRATQVARMAAAAGLTVVPHMSGAGLGYLDVIHFASFTPNVGPFMEFKGNASVPVSCATSSLKCEKGQVRCPTGVGFGVTVDQDFVKKSTPVKSV
jgi:L-alanine-DL-glutamate epimerase-like enolase superfamily enzyme